MESRESHADIVVGSEKSFGLVFSGAFLILGLYPLIHGRGPILWCFGVSAAFLMATWKVPKVLRPLNIVWFKFGMLLARIVQPIVMAAIFFLVVTPVGLIMRLFGKDLLRQKISADTPTYWQDRGDKSNRMGSMKDQF